MTPTGHGRSVFRRPPRRQVPVSRDRSPVPVADPRRAVSCDGSPQEVVAGSGAWEKPTDAVVDELPPGKQQLMEKFFSPVRSAGGAMGKRGSEGKPAEKDVHQRHHQQREHQHLHHYHQQGAHWTKNKQNHSYSATVDSNRRPHHHDSCHGTDHRRGHLHHPHCDHRDHHQQQRGTNATPHASGPDSSTSSGSSSSSASSSSSTWSSESSLDNETFLADRKQSPYRPQHSRSCTDVSSGRRAFEDEEEEDTKPLLEDDSHLYKSLSLERDPASRNTLDGWRAAEKPKRAGSSNLLPIKGILKNRQGPGSGVASAGNFRKAKSMEALSHKGERAGTGSAFWSGGLGKPKMGPSDVERRKEEARQNLVKEKLQFSAFLNEITRRVLSPSRLSSLGVVGSSRPNSPGRNCLRYPEEETERLEGKMNKGKLGWPRSCPDSLGSEASSIQSLCTRRTQVTRHQDPNLAHPHPRSPAAGSSPNPRHTPGGPAPEYHSDTSTSPENSLGPGQGRSSGCGLQFQVGSKTQLTDGTSTGPEPSPRLPRPSSRQPPSHHQPHNPPPQAHHHQRAQCTPFRQAPRSTPGLLVSPHLEAPAAAQGLEIRSSQSSPSQNTTGSSSEEKHLCDSNTTQGLKGEMSEADRIRLLQDQNKDLQETLLRTSLCMERMGAEFKNNHRRLEAELQRTRMELSSLRDKFERQQDNYSSTQQTNNLLEHKLCSVVQDMDGERKRLNQRISDLGEELSIAKNTIQALENINVPSVLREALKKHLQAEEAVTQFLPPVAPPPAQFMDSEHFNKPSLTGDAQSLGAVPEEEDSDWSEATEVWLCGPKGSNKGHYGPSVWKKDKLAEPKVEGAMEAVSRPPPCSFQIPHLQLTVHPETAPASITEIDLAQFKAFPERSAGGSSGPAGTGKLGSTIRTLSASLEEMHSTGTQL